jgi:hypothetical protein
MWGAVTKSLVTEAQVAEIPTTETQGFGHSLWRHDTQHKGLISDIQHNDTANMLNVVVPSVVIFYCYDECHYSECHYAECRGAGYEFGHFHALLGFHHSL